MCGGGEGGACVCVCVRVCVCACVRMRKWAEGGTGRPASFLWQRGMSGMSSTCI